MSTITRELAKLFRKITNSEIDAEGNAHVVLSPADSLLINNARIALASLEAEPVGTFKKGLFGYSPSFHEDAVPLYTYPPAPVSVPDEVCWEDVPEEITEDDMALASAWAHGFNQCRAAMLKHSEPFIVTSDHRMMEMPQVEAINAVTAMLQGVENAETPTTMQTAPALDSSPKIAELPSGNSPVIPDGWVLVPEEPTHEMLEAGDEQFGTYDVYRRMIAAAPQQEVK
ncbi:hypothetical protein R8N93_004507 [Enterobacter kobei]|nr:hypothetical protein [Enterobacter kobei]